MFSILVSSAFGYAAAAVTSNQDTQIKGFRNEYDDFDNPDDNSARISGSLRISRKVDILSNSDIQNSSSSSTSETPTDGTIANNSVNSNPSIQSNHLPNHRDGVHGHFTELINDGNNSHDGEPMDLSKQIAGAWGIFDGNYSLLAHRLDKARSVYIDAMCQRISLSSYLCLLILLRYNWNAFAFPFMPLNDVEFERQYVFLINQFFVEWFVSTLITLIIRYQCDMDVIVIGGNLLESAQFRRLSYLCTTQILMGVYITLNCIPASAWQY
jgi:hypothetical protein